MVDFSDKFDLILCEFMFKGGLYVLIFFVDGFREKFKGIYFKY
jgi:hypothetical protein